MLYLCKAIPEEVLEKGLDKYGGPEDIAKFTSWLRIYGKGSEEKVAGRKMHFAKVLPTVPDLPRKENKQAPNATSNATFQRTQSTSVPYFEPVTAPIHAPSPLLPSFTMESTAEMAAPFFGAGAANMATPFIEVDEPLAGITSKFSSFSISGGGGFVKTINEGSNWKLRLFTDEL